MLTAKEEALADEGDLLLARLVTIFMPNFIPRPPLSQALSSNGEPNDTMAGLEGEAALAALKTKLRWRDNVRTSVARAYAQARTCARVSTCACTCADTALPPALRKIHTLTLQRSHTRHADRALGLQETEFKWTKKTGWSLLHLACAVSFRNIDFLFF